MEHSDQEHADQEHARWREAASARLDGEALGVEAAALDAHLAGCPSCRSWLDQAHVLTRSFRLAPAPAPVDLAPAVLTAVAARRRPRPVARPSDDGWIFRLGLALVAVVQLGFALPDLLAVAGGNQTTHALRELGAWDVAFAVGLCFAAWRPQRAQGMLPLLAALVGVMLLLSAIDVAGGRVAALSEAPHFLAPLGLGLLWVAGRRSVPTRHRARLVPA